MKSTSRDAEGGESITDLCARVRRTTDIVNESITDLCARLRRAAGLVNGSDKPWEPGENVDDDQIVSDGILAAEHLLQSAMDDAATLFEHRDASGNLQVVSSPFHFVAPAWANTPPVGLTEEDQISRSRELAQSYYALGARTGVHSMIEWCGVMIEYVRMLEHAWRVDRIPPDGVNQHNVECAVAVPAFMVAYLAEKLGCQFKPFIRGDAATWRKEINRWFAGVGDV
jgi:hypothetical protein